VGQPTFARIHETVIKHLAGRITVAHSFFDRGRWPLPAAYTIVHRLRRPGSTACASPDVPGLIFRAIG
jgi:hypothetical protein